MTRLKELKQNENDESLGQYYRRIHEILRDLEDQNRENENDDVFFVLSHIIEKFVNELNDRQLRVKLNYKYMIEVSFEAQSLYDVYLIAEEYSDRIASKKKALEDEFERELSIVMQTQDTAVALKFAMKNQSESYTQKSKSVSVDRIERYRSQQHKKLESTAQKKIAKKETIEAASASKLTQPYIDVNSSNSNVSALGRISGESQTTSHLDSSISKNVMILSSQSRSICDSVFNDRLIRSEKSIVNEIHASESNEWLASITISAVNESPLILKKVSCNLSEISTDIVNSINIRFLEKSNASESAKCTAISIITAVNKSSSVLQKKSYQMLENRSISSHSASSSSPVSSSRISKP